jgi:tRNA(Ile)-lysidine synthase
MWNRVEKYIKKHHILSDNGFYIVALSGGADSVALLLMLHDAGYKIHAAHCNFHLRGDESDRDERFCTELCERLGIILHHAHFDTREYAALRHQGIEEAARNLRYSWFRQLKTDISADGICVAHHRDDSVETVLMNMVRGTGLRGLTGISPLKDDVLRPLLCVSRQDIEEYLRRRGQAYVTDSTNLVPDCQRNKIRLQLLPLLRTLNPAVDDNIQRMAENLAEAQAVLDAVTNRFEDCNKMEIPALQSYGSSEYVVYEWLKRYGFNGDQAAQILHAGTGSVITSSLGFEVLKDRGKLMVEHQQQPMKPLKIPEAGTYQLPAIDYNCHWQKIRVETMGMYDGFEPSKSATVATIDADKVVLPLTLRRVEVGDTMRPFGMKGSKLVSDLLTDMHKNIFEKRRQMVVVDSFGNIVWLVGIRIDDRVRIMPEKTRRILQLAILC